MASSKGKPPRSRPTRTSAARLARLPTAACTIISRNYLAQALVLAKSYLKHFPGGRFFVLAVDGLPEGAKLGPAIQLVGPEELGLSYFYEMCFRYDVTELCTAVKPTFLSFLLDRHARSVIYFDPDILIQRPLDELDRVRRSADIVLTPHLVTPIPDDGHKPSEQDILIAGAYNLGFMALRESRQARELLQWWEERLREGCRIDPAHGLFTDQKWIDLVPGLFPSTSILRDETYNVAYWNLHARALERRGNRYLVKGRPMAFFHFSGFNPETPHLLSKHQTRTKVIPGTALARLLERYVALLRRNGYRSASRWEYGYLRFDNGTPVHSLLRRAYLSLDEPSRARFGNPFHTNGTRPFLDWAVTPGSAGLSPFLEQLYRLRDDVAAAFPDVHGKDREGFLNWARTGGSREMGYDPQWATPGHRASPVTVRIGNKGVQPAAQQPDADLDAAPPSPGDSAREPSASSFVSKRDRYEAMKYRIRRMVRTSLPRGSRVAVVSKGDDELLDFEGSEGWHFPQNADGVYAGYHPADAQTAIAHLEALRKKGADFLVFPEAAFWWLDHYTAFRSHLDDTYPLVAFEEATCRIFALCPRPRLQEPDDELVPGNATEMRPFGVNVTGYFTSEKGVGEAARSDVRFLQATKIPFVLNDCAAAGSLNSAGDGLQFSRENPYRINLVHINADQAAAFASQHGDGYFRDRYNIGYWVWELSQFPDAWIPSFKYFDEIWVPSNFTLDAISRVAPVPVVRIPHTVSESPATSGAGRSSFGLPEDPYVFLFMFDAHSYLARKNPLGLIKAFRKAFRRDDHVVLALKASHCSRAQFAELRCAAEGANIRIIEDILPRHEVNDLLRVADCYVSLHRSEGFGLTMAEAMNLGKPVIATAYSANMDFMTPANAFLVNYTLTEIDEDHGPYERGRVWAEPDADHAAQWMRFVYENRDVAGAVGRRAQQDIARLLHAEAVAPLVRDRLMRADLVHQRRRLAIDPVKPGGLASSPANAEPVHPVHGLENQGELLAQLTHRVDEALASVDERVQAQSAAQEDATRSAEARLGELETQSSLREAQWVQCRARIDETEARHEMLAARLAELEARVTACDAGLAAAAGHDREFLSRLDQSARTMRDHAEQLDRVSRTVGDLQGTLGARPFMARDAFGAFGDLTAPMGYALDAAKAGEQPVDSHDFLDFFRGDPAFIADRQRVYVALLKGCRTIVDLGCGRGEFLELATEAGMKAIGVEQDASLVNRLKEKGFDVVHADALEFLRAQPEGSFDGIFSAQFIEHLQPCQLAELLDVAKSRLRRGGVFIAETVNPESFRALKVFHTDLTHHRPIFPQVLLFLCRDAGFPSSRIFYPCGGGFTQVNYQTAGEYAVVALA